VNVDETITVSMYTRSVIGGIVLKENRGKFVTDIHAVCRVPMVT
jgi:hypothetical protein